MRLFTRQKSDSVPRRRQSPTAGSARREAADRMGAASESNTTFRRNRTLTGSLSSRVSSVNERQADLKSPRIHIHDLTKQRRTIGSVLAATIIVCIAIGGLLLQFTARPVAAAADGSISLQHDRYEKIIDEYLSRHPVERLRFVLNEARLNEYVQQRLPEVSRVNAGGAAGFGAGEFQVSVRSPLVSWMIGSSQYFVDASGVSFQKNYYDAPTVKIVDRSGVEQTAGMAIASSRFLNFVGRSVSTAKNYGLIVEQAIIPQGTTRQIELRAAGHEYPVKLSLDRSVGEQVEDMNRAITFLENKNIRPQYIDVRVSGKAFYK